MLVSPYCLGMVDEPDVVLAAFDAGINFFFLTCDMHWPLYEPLRVGLARLLARSSDIRSKIVVGVVSYVAQPPFQSVPFMEAVASVPGLGGADVLILGGVYRADLLPRLEQAHTNVERGLVGARAVGASLHDRVAALQAARYHLVDVGFVRYNPAHPGARSDLFPFLPAKRPLLYNFKSAHGYVAAERMAELGIPSDEWRPHITDHYRFALAQGGVDGVLCSPRDRSQVSALLTLAGKPTLEYLINVAALDAGLVELASD
jgi:hypothetical protein